MYMYVSYRHKNNFLQFYMIKNSLICMKLHNKVNIIVLCTSLSLNIYINDTD